MAMTFELINENFINKNPGRMTGEPKPAIADRSKAAIDQYSNCIHNNARCGFSAKKNSSWSLFFAVVIAAKERYGVQQTHS